MIADMILMLCMTRYPTQAYVQLYHQSIKEFIVKKLPWKVSEVSLWVLLLHVNCAVHFFIVVGNFMHFRCVCENTDRRIVLRSYSHIIPYSTSVCCGTSIYKLYTYGGAAVPQSLLLTPHMDTFISCTSHNRSRFISIETLTSHFVFCIYIYMRQ